MGGEDAEGLGMASEAHSERKRQENARVESGEGEPLAREMQQSDAATMLDIRPEI